MPQGARLIAGSSGEFQSNPAMSRSAGSWGQRVLFLSAGNGIDGHKDVFTGRVRWEMRWRMTDRKHIILRTQNTCSNLIMQEYTGMYPFVCDG